MKAESRIAVVAVLMLIASAGALYPLHVSLREAQAEVDLLESDLQRDAGVHDQLMSAHARRVELNQRLSERAFRLCPDTPEAEHQVESDLLQRVENSGLSSVRMDRRKEQLDGDNPALVIELLVDGDGQALNRFLRSVEEMAWVTRVVNLEVAPGNSVRRINVQVAVMLERNP